MVGIVGVLIILSSFIQTLTNSVPALTEYLFPWNLLLGIIALLRAFNYPIRAFNFPNQAFNYPTKSI